MKLDIIELLVELYRGWVLCLFCVQLPLQIPHLAQLFAFFWIPSNLVVAICTQRAGIIEIVRTSFRLRDDVVNFDERPAASCTQESRASFGFKFDGFGEWHVRFSCTGQGSGQ